MSGTDAHGQPFTEVKHRGLITVSVMVAMIMVILDMTIANVALPHMQASLGAVAGHHHLGADLLYRGRRRSPRRSPAGCPTISAASGCSLICVAGFVASSALCGTAFGLEEMVLFRVLQGAFGAALAPLSQSVILDINPRERQGQAMAMWGMGIMIAPIIGPTLGAYLTDNFNWRWVFYINVPIGIAALRRRPRCSCRIPSRRIRSFDFFGFGLLVARRRRAADHARPRRRARLVQLAGGPDRDWASPSPAPGCSSSTRSPHQRAVPRPAPVRRPQLRRGARRSSSSSASCCSPPWRCCRRCCRT